MAALPPGWKLPDLRIDVDGDWYDEGIQVTHPGILANLRGNLKKDAEGYFIQTRVRIPVRVDDAPFVLTRIERQGEGLHVVVNDGTEDTVDPATVRLGRGDPGAEPGDAGAERPNQGRDRRRGPDRSARPAAGVRRGGRCPRSVPVRDDARGRAALHAVHLRVRPARPHLEPLLLRQGRERRERDVHEPLRDLNALHGRHA